MELQECTPEEQECTPEEQQCRAEEQECRAEEQECRVEYILAIPPYILAKVLFNCKTLAFVPTNCINSCVNTDEIHENCKIFTFLHCLQELALYAS